MVIGNKNFDFSAPHVYVMGILNVTPDSFSDGGKYMSSDSILRHVEQMIEAGADIIDIGGESTRPGFQIVTPEDEARRVCEAISIIKQRYDIPISIDTYKACVLEAAINSGADIANDVWGLKLDNEKYKGYQGDENRRYGDVVAKTNVPIILMHSSRPTPAEERAGIDKHSDSAQYDNYGLYIKKFISEMDEMVKRAESYGISRDKIISDPGVGFGKTQEENLAIIKYLPDIVNASDVPVLLGTSRKSVIGKALGDIDVNSREEGTLVTTVLAAQAGCSIVRVHDVEKNVRAIKMLEAITGIS